VSEPHHRRDFRDDDANSWCADPPSGVMPHQLEWMVATVLAMLVFGKIPEARNRLAAVIAMFAGIPMAIAAIRNLAAASALAAGALSGGPVAAVDERILAYGC
jgi:hypothetical protein